jgi:ribose 5-phosphate isomerase A
MLPVEIVSFGWQTVLERIARHGLAPRLRSDGGEPFVTDSRNYIADCAVKTLSNPVALDAQLAGIVGVVETGLFLGLASAVIVGRSTGVEVLET